MRTAWAIRSTLFVLFMAVTVMPWAVVVLLLSIIWRGPRLYWVAVGWLRLAIWGARVICGVRARVTGLEHVPTAAQATSAVLLAPKQQTPQGYNAHAPPFSPKSMHSESQDSAPQDALSW